MIIRLYCGQCLMGSRIMVQIGLWNQIYPDLQVPNYSVIPNIGLSSFTYEYYLVNGICYGLTQSDPIKWGPPYKTVKAALWDHFGTN